MIKWLDWIERHNPDGLRTRELGNNYGDWLCIPSGHDVPHAFADEESAGDRLLGRRRGEDGPHGARTRARSGGETFSGDVRERARCVSKGISPKRRPVDGRHPDRRICSRSRSICLPENTRARAAEHLVENIKSLDWHLSTGFIGISHLNPQLTLAGHADVAYRLLLRDDYPSWLYPVKHGATTIWERWNGWTEQDGFFNPQMNSFNHYSLGSVGEWLFRHVAGIELDPDVPGFQQFVLRPFIGAVSISPAASYRTMHGEIVSDWKRAGNKLTWTVRIPANTTARVHVPSEPGTKVTESGVPVEKAEGLHVVGREGRFLVCKAGAGGYTFVSELKD